MWHLSDRWHLMQGLCSRLELIRTLCHSLARSQPSKLDAATEVASSHCYARLRPGRRHSVRL